MGNEMIERCAKAVFLAHAEKTAAFKRDNPGTLVADVALTYEEMARATIGAMREPTETEWKAADDLGWPFTEACEEVWTTMIDAALA